MQALTFTLPSPANSGDVLVGELDPAISDLIRFSADGLHMYFFSDVDTGDTHPDLADVGFPKLPANPVTAPEVGTEGNNSATYTPAPGQPGFSTVAQLSYTFLSDGTVPDTGSTALLLLGSLATLIGIGRLSVVHKFLG
jgi:hypothetical protein